MRSLGHTGGAIVQAVYDARLLTPLLVMALVIAAGVLFYALTGHALAAL
jgi:hypothetical protein